MKNCNPILLVLLTVCLAKIGYSQPHSFLNYLKIGKSTPTFIYHTSNIHNYESGLLYSYTTYTNYEIQNQIYPTIHKYYLGSPKTIFEATGLEEKKYSDIQYNYSSSGPVPIGSSQEYDHITYSLLNTGLYYPVTEWFGVKTMFAIKSFKGSFGFEVLAKDGEEVNLIHLAFDQTNYTASVNIFPHLNTPYFFNRVSLFAEGGISCGYNYLSTLHEYGNIFVNQGNNNSNDKYLGINRTYKGRNQTSNISLAASGGIDYKFNDQVSFFVSHGGGTRLNGNVYSAFSYVETDLGVGLKF